MFDNVGYKLKMSATVICVVGVIVSLIGGIFLMTQHMVPAGLVTIIVGTLFSWLSNLCLYGFGELVENSDIRTNILAKHELELEQRAKSAPDHSINPDSHDNGKEELEGSASGDSVAPMFHDTGNMQKRETHTAAPVTHDANDEQNLLSHSPVPVSHEVNNTHSNRYGSDAPVPPVSEIRKRRR